MKSNMEHGGHWSEQKEISGGSAPLSLTVALLKYTPLFFLRLLAFPVSFFYYLCAPRARRYSRQFLSKVRAATGRGGGSGHCVYKHFLSFAHSLIEKMAAWSGKLALNTVHFNDDDVHDLVTQLEEGRGVFLITSHLGNIEMLRALAAFAQRRNLRPFHVTSIVDFTVTERFNTALKTLNPAAMMDILSVQNLNAGAVEVLQNRLEEGGMVSIAGDRTGARAQTAAGGKRRYVFPFLGEAAAFSEGPFYLAALLEAPVYFVFGLRHKDLQLVPRYDMVVKKSPISFCGKSRREKKAGAQELARDFATLLERLCKEHPHQWYNFYDFWAQG